MASRLELQTELENILGTRNVYFQPPATVKLQYPCIIYSKTYIDITHADNMPYSIARRYTITIIDRNPDSNIGTRMLATLPLCRYDRYFATDGLNHDIYSVYY